jgi:hypothetical protein
MNNQSLPKYSLLQYLPFLLTFIIIFGVHFAFSYHFWEPSCHPDILSLVSSLLCAPGYFLIIIPNYFPSDLFIMIVSSCLYGIAGSLVLSSGKKHPQLLVLGIVFIVLFILEGWLLLGIAAASCG